MQSIDLTYVIETRVDMQPGVCVGRHSVDEETRRCAARASPLRLICGLFAKTGEGARLPNVGLKGFSVDNREPIPRFTGGRVGAF